MMRVELSCPFSQLAAALPVTRERQQVADKFDHRSVSGVKRDGSFGCVPERRQTPCGTIVSLGQGEMSEVTGGGGIGRTLRRPERSIEANRVWTLNPNRCSSPYTIDSMAQPPHCPGACSTARSRTARTTACSSGITRSR